MEFAIGVESVASFDQLFGVASFHDLSLQDFNSWEFIVNHIEILEFCAIIDNLLIHFGEVLGTFGRESADCGVAVEPSPARTDLQAVEEVVDCLIGHFQWVDSVMQVIE